MKVVTCLLAILGSSLALPSPPLVWEDIKGENVYVEPIANYTIDNNVSGRVIGGREANANSRIYQLGIFINGRSFCGASLVSTNFALSAAHCTVTATWLEVVLGAHRITETESTQLRVTVTSTNIINHPQYTAVTLENDISLIRFPNSIVTNNRYGMITLASALAENYAGQKALLTGWGMISDSASGISPVLKEVNVTVIGNALCAQRYSIIQPSTVCTSGAGTVGGCSGDSGGPLVVDDVQIGVTSFISDKGCESGLPTGYARVSSFRVWIAQNSDVPLA